MKKLVIKDIARMAGVSESAVSKAVNNYPDIPDETRRKIQKIIDIHNYHPSRPARMLRKGRNDTIAFMSGRIASYFTVDILSAVEKRTFSTGKYVHGIVPYSTNFERNIMRDVFDRLLFGREVSAVIALAMNPDPGTLLKYKKEKLPLVLIENFMKNAHTVNTDNKKGGFMAAEYLLKTGRKRIALITGGIKEGSRAGFSYAAVERKKGFEEALKAGGAALGAEFTEFSSEYTIEEGEAIFDRLIGKKIRFDAVFCASGDATAVGVMESAKKRGMKVPDDLAVVGYDDIMYSAYFNPPLTTVRQQIGRLGAAAFDTAVEAVEGKLKSFKHTTIEPELIIRRSA